MVQMGEEGEGGSYQKGFCQNFQQCENAHLVGLIFTSVLRVHALRYYLGVTAILILLPLKYYPWRPYCARELQLRMSYHGVGDRRKTSVTLLRLLSHELMTLSRAVA